MLAFLTRLVAGLCLAVLITPVRAADDLKVDGNHQYTPGRDHTALLLQGDELVRLGADGIAVKERRRLGAKYTHIAERADYFVALADSPKAVVVLDKATLKPIRDRALPYRNLTDLTLHPKLPLAYVAVKFDVTAPSYRIILFEEESGEAHEPRSFYGTWVRVHPAGTFLVTGLRDIYERGSKFFVNPDWRVHSIPDYGNIDLLLTYALDDQGRPSFMDMKTRAGGNGSGIRLSTDGARVTYLSHVGTPEFSGNLGGFDPLDLQKLPTAYATKGLGSTHDLAFHPRLPLCASSGNGIVTFFHREKGTVEKRLDKPVKFDKVHRTYFAPDGKHVVLDSEQGGVRALRGLALKLTTAEEAVVANPADPLVADNSDRVKAAQLRARRENERKADPEKAARDRAVDWLRLNNAFGPDHKIVADQTAVIDRELAAGQNVQLTIGKGLVRSETPTFLCIWNGAFFAFPLTAEQEKTFDFPKFTVVKRPGNKSGWRLSEEKVQLYDLKFTGGDTVNGKEKLTGTVKSRRLNADRGHYALKVQYVLGESTVTGYHHLGEYLPKSEGEISFSFGPILSDKRPHKGPLPIFVELVTFATSARRGETAIASNTIGQLVIVKEP